MKTIRQLQHENLSKDIFADGKVIPLSKFDWLIQKQAKQENTTELALKEQVRAYIREAKTREAIEAVSSWAYENNKETVINATAQLSSQLSQLNNDNNSGFVINEEANVQRNRLNNSILSFLDEWVKR